MLISKKGKYSVRAITALACMERQGNPVSLSALSEFEKLPVSYTEQLFNKLRRAGLVKSVKGPGGGYVLSKKPSEITLFDVLLAVGEIENIPDCERKQTNTCFGAHCKAKHLWDDFYFHVKAFLELKTIEDLLKTHVCGVE